MTTIILKKKKSNSFSSDYMIIIFLIDHWYWWKKTNQSIVLITLVHYLWKKTTKLLQFSWLAIALLPVAPIVYRWKRKQKEKFNKSQKSIHFFRTLNNFVSFYSASYFLPIYNLYIYNNKSLTIDQYNKHFRYIQFGK